MAFLGFPESLAEYEPKHYLRLAVIILGYILLRPIFIKLAAKSQRRQFDQALGKGEFAKKDDEEPDTNKSKKAKGASSGVPRTSRRLKNRAEKSTHDIHSDMPSDEDVSDLMP